MAREDTTMTVRIADDAAALARAGAEELAARTAEAVQTRGVATVALSGGSTPRALHALLAGDATLRARVPWERVHVFWGDERHVPPDDPDSNYRMARETLLTRVPIPASHVHRIRAEEPDAAAAAAAYEEELRDFFTARGLLAGMLPRFDLVLLGMGADGHTASLFPGSGAVHEARRLVDAPWVPKLQTSRITLTPPTLNAASVVVFLVSGTEKAETLQAVLEGPLEPDRYPSQVVRPAAGELVWLVDRPAARLLRNP
jgi:6-phosphogluconolactonase